MESMYYRTLDATSKLRYDNKLTISIKGQPFKISDPYLELDFKDDLSLWPPIEYGSIYSYLITTEGQYTKESLKAYKSLEAYLYFDGGLVQAVLYSPITEESPFCILKAKVLPSQKSRDKAYAAWVMAEKQTGTIRCAHCTCMAGLGEVCSHIAAILFKVEAAVRLEIAKKSCTDEACKWNQAFSKKVNPAPASKIKFLTTKAAFMQEQPVAGEQSQQHLLRLKQLSTSPVILTCLSDGSTTESASEEESTESMHQAEATCCEGSTSSWHRTSANCFIHPFCLKEAKQNFINLTPEEVIERLCCISEEQCEEICKQTQEQNECPLWFGYRYGRITASKCHAVLQCMRPNSKANKQRIVNCMLNSSNFKNVPRQLKWGKDNEETALQAFVNKLQAEGHKDVTLQKTGLHICRDQPFMAASPDGILSCSCCGTRLIEVKCPFNQNEIQNKDVAQPEIAKLLPYLTVKDGTLHLKKNHSYFHQVQCQMACTGVSVCDFVVWTTVSMWTERIAFNEELWTSWIPSFRDFFLQHLYTNLMQ